MFWSSNKIFFAAIIAAIIMSTITFDCSYRQFLNSCMAINEVPGRRYDSIALHLAAIYDAIVR